MTQSKRIALNTIATYGRSMLGVLCGIFTVRWVLEALGQVDFGLYGLVASLVIFISFLNIQFSGAISRYYAFTIGRAKAGDVIGNVDALKECRAWFSTALVVHAIGPFVLSAVGYPIGSYAITHAWLNIPMDKVGDCLWLWRIVCLSSFIGMFNVPFQAMYTAKQNIAELTLFSIGQTLAKTGVIYYMSCHKGDWLVLYGLWMGIITVIPSLLIAVRAFMIYPECRWVQHEVDFIGRIKLLGGYAFWQGIGGAGYIAAHQMMSVLITRFFGARENGAFSVSQTVAGEAASLTVALQSAFMPAITTACGAGNQEEMRKMACRMCKIGALLTLLFALPMALEIDEILKVWLKIPPPHTSTLCFCTLAFIVVEKLSCGQVAAICATGEVAKFQAVRCGLRILVIPFAIIAYFLGGSISAVAVSLPASIVFVVFGDALMARRRAGLSFRHWVFQIVIPIMIVSVAAGLVGCLPRTFMGPSICRIMMTTICAGSSILMLSWVAVLSHVERSAILNYVRGRFVKIGVSLFVKNEGD